jgi:hypothetical protein
MRAAGGIVRDDVVALGDHEGHLERDIGEGAQLTLVEGPGLLDVQRGDHAGHFCYEVRRSQLAECIRVVGIQRFEIGLDHLDILWLGPGCSSPVLRTSSRPLANESLSARV